MILKILSFLYLIHRKWLRSSAFFYCYYYYFYKVLEVRCIVYTCSNLSSHRPSSCMWLVVTELDTTALLASAITMGNVWDGRLLHSGSQSEEMGRGSPCCPKRSLKYKWGFNLCCICYIAMSTSLSCLILLPSSLKIESYLYIVFSPTFAFSTF